MTIDLIQKSDEWHTERLGSLGASEVYQATKRTKTGWSAERETLMTKKLVERVTGIVPDQIRAPTIQHGVDNEAPARSLYEMENMVTVKEVGLFKHNRIARTHASPDGVRSDSNVGIEIKAPTSATHLETLISGEVPEKYIKQCLWQMACAGFERVDYVSYDPRFPEQAIYFCKAVQRDDKAISELEEMVEEFLHELAKREKEFHERFNTKEAA
jgi:putative phage-type endonuclease